MKSILVTALLCICARAWLLPPKLRTFGSLSSNRAVSVTDIDQSSVPIRSILDINDLRKSLPPAVFEKSLPKSAMYMIFDFLMWGGTVFGMWSLTHSPIWANFAIWQKAIATGSFWAVAGFFMWCIFVIGHDCGHGTFSKNEKVNNILGHVTHGSLLVPFFSWQLSHRRHHMFHNHEHKDYSHPWYTPQRFEDPDEGFGNFLDRHTWVKLLFPFVAWQVYLLGKPDGNHFVPNEQERLWRGTPKVEFKKCLISSAVVLANLVGAFMLCGNSLSTFGFFYLGPWIMFGWWLMTVTYLQHHSPDTLVYGDEDWTFTNAAFETVDRTYGWGVDELSHHITDGHVIHHLFYTLIPHYHLAEATRGLRSYLEDKGLAHKYKLDDTRDFPVRLYKYLLDFCFRAKRAPLTPVAPPAPAEPQVPVGAA